MSQFQAQQFVPTAYGQQQQQRHSHTHQYQQHTQQQSHNAHAQQQAMLEYQMQQQQAQAQANYIAQLQLQSHLILQQQIAAQQQQQAFVQAAMRSPPLQQGNQFARQQQQSFGYQSQSQQQGVGAGRSQLSASRGAGAHDKRSQSASRADAAKSWLPTAHADKSKDATAVGVESTNPLVASALARQRKRASLNLDQTQHAHSAPVTSAVTPVEATSRSSSVESNHHRRSSSGQGSTHSVKSHGSPEPPALIVSRPGEPFPDTSGSETSSVNGDQDNGLDGDIDRFEAERLNKSLEQVSLGNGAPPRVSQASSLAKALSGRNRQRPASLTGLASPPLAAALNSDAPAFNFTQPQQQTRAVSDGSPLSPFANTYTPLAPLFSPTLSQFTSPPIPQTPTFTNNGGNLNASGRAQAPVKGGAAAMRMPKGPVGGGGGDKESNFAGRLRRAAIAQLACSARH